MPSYRESCKLSETRFNIGEDTGNSLFGNCFYSISMKTLGIVSLGISSYIGAHYLSGELDTLVVFASNFDYYILIPFGKTYVFLFVKLAYLDYSLL
jgi:hypothetical protein